MEFQVLTQEFQDYLSTLEKRDLGRYIFVSEHPDYKAHLKLDCFDEWFVKDFFDLAGEYRAVSLLRLPKLIDRAEERGYELVWLVPPEPFLERLQSLHEPYPCKLNVDLFPFQLQGFNWLKDERADIPEWSTGTGKSIYACAKALYLLEYDEVDQVVVVSKRNKRIEYVRELETKAGLEAELIGFYKKGDKFIQKSGKAEERAAFRSEQYAAKVWVTNYEKFRLDKEAILKALKGKRVYFVWDEMPMKLKNQQTQLYRAVKAVVNKTKVTYQSCLSATPLDNMPEDIYWCVRLMDKTALDRYVAQFRQRYVKTWDYFAPGQVSAWDVTKLRELGMRLAHMTHQANKYRDADIRAQFPEEHWETIPIEMSSQDRKLYHAIAKEIVSEYWEGGIEHSMFARLAPLQLVCNNPLHLGDGEVARKIRSKTELTDKHCTKLETLKDLLNQIEGKVIVFSMYSEEGTHWLLQDIQGWGHEAVLYEGTETQMQATLDAFKTDPSIKVFVSSDKGSDSINLEEATSVINYDLPWKYSTLLQRVNRISRITSKGIGVDHVFFYNLIYADSMEERKETIIERKKAYGEAVFGGDIADHAEEISRLTKDELLWIVTGDEL